ncbi:unnamed protein product [Urochloa humidicola]
MHGSFAETPLRTRRRGLVVVSLVYERNSCSEDRATTRHALQQPLRGDGGGGDPLRARERLLCRSRFAPNQHQQTRHKVQDEKDQIHIKNIKSNIKKIKSSIKNIKSVGKELAEASVAARGRRLLAPLVAGLGEASTTPPRPPSPLAAAASSRPSSRVSVKRAPRRRGLRRRLRPPPPRAPCRGPR